MAKLESNHGWRLAGGSLINLLKYFRNARRPKNLKEKGRLRSEIVEEPEGFPHPAKVERTCRLSW